MYLAFKYVPHSFIKKLTTFYCITIKTIQIFNLKQKKYQPLFQPEQKPPDNIPTTVNLSLVKQTELKCII